MLKNLNGVFCEGNCETPKQKVEWSDLISLPTRARPTGLGGCGMEGADEVDDCPVST